MPSTHSPRASGPCEQVRRLQAEALAGRQTADCTRAQEFPEKLADLPGNFSNHLHFKGIGAPLLHGEKKKGEAMTWPIQGGVSARKHSNRKLLNEIAN